jgi:hypothetical protein
MSFSFFVWSCLMLSINVGGCLEYAWMFRLNKIKWFGNMVVGLLIFFGLLLCVFLVFRHGLSSKCLKSQFWIDIQCFVGCFKLVVLKFRASYMILMFWYYLLVFFIQTYLVMVM